MPVVDVQQERQEHSTISQSVLTCALESPLDPASYWHFQIRMQGTHALSN